MSESLEEWAAKQSLENLMCRDTGIRHQWDPSTAYVNEEGHRVEVIRCGRCEAEKLRFYDRDGSVLRTKSSHYNEEYLRKGAGRVTKEENATVRNERLSRMWEFQAADEEIQRRRPKRKGKSRE